VLVISVTRIGITSFFSSEFFSRHFYISQFFRFFNDFFKGLFIWRRVSSVSEPGFAICLHGKYQSDYRLALSVKLNEQALRVLFAFHRFCKPQNSCVLPAPLEGIILNETIKEKSHNNPIQAVLALPGLLKRRRIFKIVRHGEQFHTSMAAAHANRVISGTQILLRIVFKLQRKQ